MEEEISLSIQRKSTYLIIGKIIVVILLGACFGILISESSMEDAQKAKELTKEKYMADYDNYKAGLTEDPISGWASIIVFIIFSVVIFGLYELTGKLLAWLLGLFLDRDLPEE
jgi:hypothetical protein